MKNWLLLCMILLASGETKAWWDPGHLVTAMIAYENLDEAVRARVDELTRVLQRDYPYVNHFITTGPWPDDLKAEGVRAYDTWHYTNLPYNRAGVALPDQPEVDIIWAINQSVSILGDERSRAIDKARFLGFLVHLVGDLHQPLHSTSMFTNELPGGNRGGNEFALEGEWRNLHALWDDGCGYLSAYNDINPYGQPKEGLSETEIERIRALARDLMTEHPASSFPAVEVLDPDFWALESHKLAIRYGYRGLAAPAESGRPDYLEPGETPTDYYLEEGQSVVRRQLALAGYRLARLLNELF